MLRAYLEENNLQSKCLILMKNLCISSEFFTNSFYNDEEMIYQLINIFFQTLNDDKRELVIFVFYQILDQIQDHAETFLYFLLKIEFESILKSIIVQNNERIRSLVFNCYKIIDHCSETSQEVCQYEMEILNE